MLESKNPSNVFAALDLGSTHITLVLGATPKTVLASTRIPSNCMRQGGVVDFENLVSCLQEVLDDVQRQSGVEVEHVRVSVSSIKAFSENFYQKVTLRNNEVQLHDLEKLSALSMAQNSPIGFDVLHNIQGRFALDDRQGIHNPLNMWGEELGSLYHRVFFPQKDLINIVRACNRAGVQVTSFVFEALAAAQATLTEDEKELGAVCINLGAHLSHVVIYSGGLPILSKDLPIGSHHITKDLSIGLRTSLSEAERIKKEYAQVQASLINRETSFSEFEINTMNGSNTRKIHSAEIAAIVEPRVYEIFTKILNEIKNNSIPARAIQSIVLCGGGANLANICSLAETIFQSSVRLGVPTGFTGAVEGLVTPSMSTALGALSELFMDVHAAYLQEHRPHPVSVHSHKIFTTAKTIWSKIREPFL